MSHYEDIFNNDECIFINHLSFGEDLRNYNRNKLLSQLNFQMSLLTENSDELVVELVTETLSKVNQLTDYQWEEIKKKLPLPCMDEDIYEESDYDDSDYDESDYDETNYKETEGV